MSDSARPVCPHCNVAIASNSVGNDFWVRCGGCGRRVMPKAWSRIVSDPEPSALFRPSVTDRRASRGRADMQSLAQAGVGNRRRLTRHHVIALAIPAIVAFASACMWFTTWFTTSDMLISGFMGFLITVFILFVPSLLVCVGTGAITLAFFGYMFNFSGNELFWGAYYFLFGFVTAGLIQWGRHAMTKIPDAIAVTHEVPSGVETAAESVAKI